MLFDWAPSSIAAADIAVVTVPRVGLILSEFSSLLEIQPGLASRLMRRASSQSAVFRCNAHTQCHVFLLFPSSSQGSQLSPHVFQIKTQTIFCKSIGN